MTPHQKLKHIVLLRAVERDNIPILDVHITKETVDELYDEWRRDWRLQELGNELRSGDVVTNVPHEYSRHYESKSVAVQTLDGSWVGWTYWYGGGKHSEPEAEPWMNKAYNLSCTEEQKLVTIRTFTKK